MTRLWEGPGAEGYHSGCRHMGNQHGVGRGAGTRKSDFSGSFRFSDLSSLAHTLTVCACGEQI